MYIDGGERRSRGHVPFAAGLPVIKFKIELTESKPA
jgi:hypothetical protein